VICLFGNVILSRDYIIESALIDRFLGMAQRINPSEGLLMNVVKSGEPVSVFLNLICRFMLTAAQSLPDGETNILVTSALPYCNNVPHLGAYGN
jgi:hypothetical protein